MYAEWKKKERRRHQEEDRIRGCTYYTNNLISLHLSHPFYRKQSWDKEQVTVSLSPLPILSFIIYIEDSRSIRTLTHSPSLSLSLSLSVPDKYVLILMPLSKCPMLDIQCVASSFRFYDKTFVVISLCI